MGRYRSEKDGLSKGAWTAVEDQVLLDYVKQHGEGQWCRVSRETGLKRSGKSCRLRWLNYLRPEIKRGNITEDEEDLIIRLQKLLGNRWSLIAGRLPGRTDNEIKNYWNSILRKKTKENQAERSRNERKSIKDVSPEAVPSSETYLHLSRSGSRQKSCMRNDLDKMNTLAEPLITEVKAKNMEAEPDSIDGLLPVTGESDMTRNFLFNLNAGQLSISEFLHTDFSKLSEFNTTTVDCTSGCRNGSSTSASTAEAPLHLQELLNDWAENRQLTFEGAFGA